MAGGGGRSGTESVMLEAFKAAGAFANLLRNKETTLEAVSRLRGLLDKKRITAEGGGGVVRVTIDGWMCVQDIQIDPKALTEGDDAGLTMSRQIIADAVNKAVTKARDFAGKEIAREMDALGIPMIPGLEGLRGV